MKTLLVPAVILLSVCIGCGEEKMPATAFATPSVHHDWIAELKAEARNRHMKYRIFCMEWSDNPTKQFQAMLCSGPCGGEAGELYDMTWQAGQGATQAEAAEALFRDIASQGWYPPKPTMKRRNSMEHKQCPPEIEGDFTNK